MPIRRTIPLIATLALAALSSAFGAQAADLPGHHPAYLHALSDLRHARWNLTHRPGDAAVNEQERIAVAEVDRAIAEAMRAAGDDGKNVAQDEHEDASLDHPGALHHAQDLLIKAKQDVAQGEDNPEARRLRGAVVQHIDLALEATRSAIRDVEQHR
ncbi:MAG TPA: hypothetical protein VES00_16695 [Burkholderiaceae bacterium]|jgi:hypothetical protein|nr:hypothetical protein [Burkholderiaceae bacterium]